LEHSWQTQPERGSLHYLPLSGHSESHPDAALKTLITEGYAPYLQRIGEAMPHSEEPAAWDAWALTVFAAHRQFQVLTALRSGPFGVEGINRLAYRALRVWLEQQSYPEALHWPELPGLWYLGRPVLVTGNDYALKLMNGDVGICLWRPDPGQPGQRLALVAFADGEGGVRWVLPGRLQNIETVFAMTVHKSQGSEFSHSLLVLPDTPSPVLTKELLYTGITRASRRFTLACADDGVLQQTLNARVQRASGLDSAAAMKDATS
jgi:exodeoxyribonuclease V alpha subunit